jgi:hypothetical protein
MLLLDLNDDALTGLLEACTKHSLLALSGTSSRFYLLVLPLLLRNIQLRGDQVQMSSLFNFLMSGTRLLSAPGTHVKLLKLVSSPVMSVNFYRSWTRTLTDAIELMPNLHSIDLRTTNGALAENIHLIIPKLMTHPQIRSIALSGVGSLASHMLGEATRTSDTLHSLTIYTGEDLSSLVASEGVGKVLAEARGSLRQVELRGYDFQTFTLPTRSQTGHGTSTIENSTYVEFPLVTTLSLAACNISLSLTLSFPGVRYLTVNGLEFLPWPDFADASVRNRSPRILFPELHSLTGLMDDVDMILSLRTPDTLCRLDVQIRMRFLRRRLGEYITERLLPVLFEAPNLRSLHIFLNVGYHDDGQWWLTLGKLPPHLTFLNITIHTEDAELTVVVRPLNHASMALFITEHHSSVMIYPEY